LIFSRRRPIQENIVHSSEDCDHQKGEPITPL
jgi:hypothetical protein